MSGYYVPALSPPQNGVQNVYPPKPKLLSTRVSATAIALLSLFVFVTSVAAGSGHASSLKGVGLVHQSSTTSQEDNIKGLAKDVVEKLAAEDFEGVRENFNEHLRVGLPAEKIEQVWTAVTQQIGSFESQGPPRLVRPQVRRILRVVYGL